MMITQIFDKIVSKIVNAVRPRTIMSTSATAIKVRPGVQNVPEYFSFPWLAFGEF